MSNFVDNGKGFSLAERNPDGAKASISSTVTFSAYAHELTSPPSSILHLGSYSQNFDKVTYDLALCAVQEKVIYHVSKLVTIIGQAVRSFWP